MKLIHIILNIIKRIKPKKLLTKKRKNNTPSLPENENTIIKLETDEVPQKLILPENRLAVLTDETIFTDFMEAVNEYSAIRMVYLVVDSDSLYRDMARCFPQKQTCQLYRDYLDNFRINQTR